MQNHRQRFYSEWRSQNETSPLKNLSRFYPESPKLANLELAEGLEDLILEESEEDFEGFNLDQVDGSMGLFSAPKQFQFIGEAELKESLNKKNQNQPRLNEMEIRSIDSFEILIEQKKAAQEQNGCTMECCQNTVGSPNRNKNTQTNYNHGNSNSGMAPKFSQPCEMGIRIRSEIDSSLNNESISKCRMPQSNKIHRKIFKIEDQNSNVVGNKKNYQHFTNQDKIVRIDLENKLQTEANERFEDPLDDLELETASMLCNLDEEQIDFGFQNVSFDKQNIKTQNKNQNNFMTQQNNQKNKFKRSFVKFFKEDQNTTVFSKNKKSNGIIMKPKDSQIKFTNSKIKNQNLNKISGLEGCLINSQNQPNDLTGQDNLVLKKVKQSPTKKVSENKLIFKNQSINNSNLVAECLQANIKGKRFGFARGRSQSFMVPRTRKIFDFMKRRY